MSRLTPPVSPRDHSQGSPRALVTLVEYGDFECPHCAAAHPVVKQVQEGMGARLRFVYRHFPLTQIHPHAQRAAEMAEAAAQQGKFWPMHDLLFENQSALEDEQLVAYAASLGVEAQWARGALADGRFQRRVRDDFASGVRSGVNGTPTFFINGERYDGPWDALLETLEEATINAPL